MARFMCALAAVVAAGASVPRVALALEVHSFFDDACRVRSGVLIQVADETVRFIRPDGVPDELPTEGIAAVVVHRTLENPLARISVEGRARELIRQVWVGQDRSPTFTGWAVGFHDELILFLDLEGKTHLLDREDIHRIRKPAQTPTVVQPPRFAAAQLDFPPELLPCQGAQPRGTLRPIRVVADRIKVGDLIAKLGDRYLDLASFEERTRVYPRPFIFDRTMRLGLGYAQGTSNIFPLYFQWANGRPYRFQSFTAVGNIRIPWLPTHLPSVSFRSDVKSHFFNASFAGHLLSLPAGNSAFTLGRQLLPARPAPSVDVLFNYLVLMGADYGAWSVAGGPVYLATRVLLPAAAMNEASEWEVLAANASPAVRLMFTATRFKLRALYFRTRQARSDGEGLQISDGGGRAVPRSYGFQRDSFRVGGEVDLGPEIRLGADAIVSIGSWSDNAPAVPPRRLSFRQVTGQLSASQSFGRYVSVCAYGNVHLDRYDHDGAVSSPAAFRLGGALEFLF